MILTDRLIDNFFDDSFAIRRMNKINDSFVKRFSIDNKFDFDSIDAKVVDGLLTLSIPYKAEVKPRKIKVS